jgi:DNA polymerase V
MQPVLHSSCSAPVPYVSGMTALEIDTCVRAGFPSPAEDFQAERIDVLKYIVLHPQATYTLRVRGDSMRDEGIFDGDVILVDRAIKPRHGHIVVAVVDGAFTCKKLWLRVGKLKLLSANPDFPDIVPCEGQTIEVWGVVLASVKRFQN